MSETTSIRLKRIMEERNLKQSDILAKAKPFCEKYNVKLGKSDLSQFVSGKVAPGQWKLTILGLALNVSEAWLMGLDVPMERKKDSISEAPEIDKNLQKIIDCYKKMDHIGQESLVDQAEFLLSKHPKEETESYSA